MNEKQAKKALLAARPGFQTAVEAYLQDTADYGDKWPWKDGDEEALVHDFDLYTQAAEMSSDAMMVAEMVIELWTNGDLSGYLGDNPGMGPLERSNHDLIAWAADHLGEIVADRIRNNVTYN